MTDIQEPDQRLNLYQRMNKVMMEVEGIQKESKKVNGQYTFVSHDAVARKLHGPLTRWGIMMLPSVVGMMQDGNRTHIRMSIRFVNIDDPQEFFEVASEAFGIDPSDKGPGKAMSYAVKMALLKVFCLETGDDIENDKDLIDHVPAKKEVLAQSLSAAAKKPPIPSTDELDMIFDDAVLPLVKSSEFINEYIAHIADKTKKSSIVVVQSGIDDPERFAKCYNTWLTRKELTKKPIAA